MVEILDLIKIFFIDGCLNSYKRWFKFLINSKIIIILYIIFSVSFGMIEKSIFKGFLYLIIISLTSYCVFVIDDIIETKRKYKKTNDIIEQAKKYDEN